MKILVVEDDRPVAQTLQLLLSGYSYAVDVAEDGETGLAMAEAFQYDLILLDVMLPGQNGIDVCRQLRTKGLKCPILLLTGQGGGQQKAIALNAGADDYVVKPFDTDELIARVQALLRRGGPTTQPILTWGNLSVDPSNRKVAYGNHLLSVTPKEYAILELLLRNPQRALSTRSILEHVWTSLESSGEETVRVHIKELRQKLTAVGAPKDFIKTQHRVGYQLNLLYSSASLPPPTEPLTVPQFAELNAVNAELRTAIEHWQSMYAALQQQYQELKTAYHTIVQDHHQLQVDRGELELRVTERTAELVVATQSWPQPDQQEWQTLLEQSPEAIALVADDGHFLNVNSATCHLLGQSKDGLLYSRLVEFALPNWTTHPGWQPVQILPEEAPCPHDRTAGAVECRAIASFAPGRHLISLQAVNHQPSLPAG